MKPKYFIPVISVLLVISLLINIKLTLDARKYKQTREEDLMLQINHVTKDAEELLRSFISSGEKEKSALTAAAYQIIALQHLINSERSIGFNAPANLDFIGTVLINGGDINGHKIGGVYAEGADMEKSVAFLVFLAEGLLNTYGCATFDEYNERLAQFYDYFFGQPPYLIDSPLYPYESIE